MSVTAVCDFCGISYPTKSYSLKIYKTHFCSSRCMGLAKRTPDETRDCAYCGKMFVLRKHTREKAQRQYCSRSCLHKANGPVKTARALERFWTKIAHCEHEWLCPYCCWPWTAAIGTSGYGKTTYQSKTVGAHIRAWELWHKQPFPEGKKAAHYCDNHPCCNPMHVFPATPAEIEQHKKKHGHVLSGSANGHSVLEEQDVPVIFALHHAGLQAKTIARTYEVGPTTIHNILHRRTWGHVPIDAALLILREKPKPFRHYTSEEKRAYWRAWFWDNHELCLERMSAYQKAHPEKVVAHAQRRRARKKNAPINDFTKDQWQEVLQAFGYRCAYCGKKSRRLEQEHVTALSKNGSHTLHNIVPACHDCNRRKYTGLAPVPIQPLLLTVAKPSQLQTKQFS